MSKLKRILKYVLSFVPNRLPIGVAEFDAWAGDVLALSPIPDNDSTRFTVAVMILHLDPACCKISKHYFIKRLTKAAANEVANGVIIAMKTKQQQAVAEAKALAAAKDVTSGPQLPTTESSVVPEAQK